MGESTRCPVGDMWEAIPNTRKEVITLFRVQYPYKDLKWLFRAAANLVRDRLHEGTVDFDLHVRVWEDSTVDRKVSWMGHTNLEVDDEMLFLHRTNLLKSVVYGGYEFAHVDITHVFFHELGHHILKRLAPEEASNIQLHELFAESLGVYLNSLLHGRDGDIDLAVEKAIEIYGGREERIGVIELLLTVLK